MSVTSQLVCNFAMCRMFILGSAFHFTGLWYCFVCFHDYEYKYGTDKYVHKYKRQSHGYKNVYYMYIYKFIHAVSS